VCQIFKHLPITICITSLAILANMIFSIEGILLKNLTMVFSPNLIDFRVIFLWTRKLSTMDTAIVDKFLVYKKMMQKLIIIWGLELIM
jgi:hypothetical protein